MSPQVSAEIYKWTNADGELVYSQSPPPHGITAIVVDAGDNSSDTTSDAGTEVLAASATVPESKPQQASKVMSNCEIAQRNIAMLRLATPESEFTNAAGEQITYTQIELNSNIRTNQELAKAWCDR
jgi:hypothetical protein